MTLQNKWDANLLTNYFNNPHYRMWRTFSFFKINNNLSDDEALDLLRVPHHKLHRNTDTYGFIAMYLPKLYKVLENRDITDVLDIVFWLNNKNIDTNEETSKSIRNYFRNAMGNEKIIRARTDLERSAHKEHNKKCNRSNWMATK